MTRPPHPTPSNPVPSEPTASSSKTRLPAARRYAGVDLGTNSIRLLVAESRGDGRLVPLLRLGESCRLGEGLEANGRISEEAELRARESLESFIRRARALKPASIAVAATHAMRSATNGEEVARRLSESVGLPIEILSGEEEARFVYEAVHHALGEERLPEPCLVMDIGGGSVEVVRAAGREVTDWVSLHLGCVRLTERFLVGDPPIPEEIARLEAHVRSEIGRYPGLFEGLESGAGVGGTLTALAALDLGLVRYEAGRVEGHVLRADAIDRWTRQLAALKNEERCNLPAIGRGRADIIVAGCTILQVVLACSGLKELTVSTRGLRYAVVQRLADGRRG